MNYLFDENGVRYTYVSSCPGSPFNWIFIPGGPGGDSSYLYEFSKSLHLPGNTWLIDFPGNGSNDCEGINYDTWFSLLLPTLKKFDNPVLIGHSFGGMFPLLFEELEHVLKGFIIFNSFPKLWHDAAAKYASTRKLPDYSIPMTEFIKNPSQETFRKALDACAPYYFHESVLEERRHLLTEMPFNYHAALWWQIKATEMKFNATWVPQKVKTLHVGGEWDAITPFKMFYEDERFKRENIQHIEVSNAGHFPWIDQPHVVAKIMDDFIQEIDS